MPRYDDIHPDHIDPDTGAPYSNYSSPSLGDDYPFNSDFEDEPWTNEDEAGLEEFEEERRRRIAERNEY